MILISKYLIDVGGWYDEFERVESFLLAHAEAGFLSFQDVDTYLKNRSILIVN